MRTLLTTIAIILGLSTTAHASGVVGQSVIYRYDSTHHYPALITHDYGDGSYTLVVLDPDDYMTNWTFGPNSQAAFAAIAIAGVYQDESDVTDNRWKANSSIGVGATGPQGNMGSTGATGAPGSGGSVGATGPGALVTGSSTPSLTLNGSAAQFDSTHDTEYIATVKISTSISLTGGQAGHVDLVCDANTSPTTVVETASQESAGALTVGLSLVTSSTHVLRWRVPAGHRCKLASANDTGTPTFTLVRQLLQTLG